MLRDRNVIPGVAEGVGVCADGFERWLKEKVS